MSASHVTCSSSNNASLPHAQSSSSMANPPSCPTHVMRIHFHNQISKPKKFMDGTIRYRLSRALMATITSQEEQEPTSFTATSTSAKWCVL